MTDLEKAARMALKTLEYIDLRDNDRDFLSYKECHNLYEAITVLRQALSDSVEQPAQQSAERVEPVDWEAVAADQAMTIAMMKVQLEGLPSDKRPWQQIECPVCGELARAEPPRKPWVGLTDAEIARVVSLAGFAPDWAEANIATQIVRVCQDKLKEKNIK